MSRNCAKAGRWDIAGSAVSLTCALHCLLTPILLPLASGFMHSVWLEVGLLASALLIGGSALSHGFRVHGFRLPAAAFALGMMFIIFGNWVLTSGHPLSTQTAHSHSPISIACLIVGAVFVVGGHGANFVLERRAHANSAAESLRKRASDPKPACLVSDT